MTPEERVNAARGYKAAIHNEHVSIEAKDHAEEMLRELNEEEARHELLEGGEHPLYHRHRRQSSIGKRASSPQERINAARGYKAALHNPLVSEEGKDHARQMLEQMDEEQARRELYNLEESAKDPNRVIAGLKAAQHNPLVTEEGRRMATKKLHDIESGKPEE
ncbi:hypothetical protein PDE_08029 [Penicillium oxalicum 114-2]|uniref:Uncharacterized protein n=1 Tax=Penicillium oxalicum (strain 114-2 / CGMCC 5302) TaxID=933388 RepID=S8BDI7_PENO1|nr:hypothetical protein PDE_08029 [Penicillium oxalicum 114-2]